MLTNIPLDQALRALHEVQAEMGQDPAPGKMIFPSLEEVLTRNGPLPRNALLFGVASDGLPLLLNLRDPAPGPILLLGDRGSGKTAFLQILAQVTARLLPAEKVQFAVLTSFPEEWQGLEVTAHRLGVFPVYDALTLNLLYDLARRVERGATDRSILLLFDGLDAALQLDPPSQDNLRYLLKYGPQARIWPIVSINAARATKLPDWLAYFRTRIYGVIDQPGVADALTPNPGAELHTLFPTSQFCMRQKAHWLRFWRPSI